MVLRALASHAMYINCVTSEHPIEALQETLQRTLDVLQDTLQGTPRGVRDAANTQSKKSKNTSILELRRDFAFRRTSQSLKVSQTPSPAEGFWRTSQSVFRLKVSSQSVFCFNETHGNAQTLCFPNGGQN